MRRHIGDYTLFMTGIFREHVERLGRHELLRARGPPRVPLRVGDGPRGGPSPTPPLFRRLSDRFEHYAGALTYARKVYFRAHAASPAPGAAIRSAACSRPNDGDAASRRRSRVPRRARARARARDAARSRPVPRDRARRRAPRAGEAPRRRCRAAAPARSPTAPHKERAEGGPARALSPGAGRHRRRRPRRAARRPVITRRAGARRCAPGCPASTAGLARRVDPLRGRARRSGCRLCSLILNDEAGILEAAGGPITRKRLEAELRLAARAPEAALGGQRSAPARRRLVAEALALHARLGTEPPAGVLALARVFFADRGRDAARSARRRRPPRSTAPCSDRSAELARPPGARRMVRRARRSSSEDALALLQARESRLVVSEQIKAEREAAIVDGVIDRHLHGRCAPAVGRAPRRDGADLRGHRARASPPRWRRPSRRRWPTRIGRRARSRSCARSCSAGSRWPARSRWAARSSPT